MPVADDTVAYRRNLPHLSKTGKTYFVTFRTNFGFRIPERSRHFVLQSCAYDHGILHWLHTAVVMPDHVHLVLTPFDATLAAILRRVKSASAYRVNRDLLRTGPLWRRESFDHILRSNEGLRKKCEYVLQNPVRAGLVSTWESYPWHWRADSEAS